MKDTKTTDPNLNPHQNVESLGVQTYANETKIPSTEYSAHHNDVGRKRRVSGVSRENMETSSQSPSLKRRELTRHIEEKLAPLEPQNRANEDRRQEDAKTVHRTDIKRQPSMTSRPVNGIACTGQKSDSPPFEHVQASNINMEMSPPEPPELQMDGGTGSGASIEKPRSSSAGSSGEEADIDSSGGSGTGEMAARRLHKGRAAIVCKDGCVPPAVDQHEGDCVVASRLVALWNAAPSVAKRTPTTPRETSAANSATQQKAAAPVTC